MSVSRAAFLNASEAIAYSAKVCMAHGVSVSPRGKPTLEIMGLSFSIEDVTDRIPRFSRRKWSLPLALGEFCWHVGKSTDVEPLAYYAPRWRSFADSDGQVRGSCYGRKAFESQAGLLSQWDTARLLLQSDVHSRRAVMIFDHQDIDDIGTFDKSCLTTIQLLLRDGKLHCIGSMRSNDIFLGMPYDIFLFTYLQELMALELGVGLGTYTHFAGSAHIYQRDIDKCMSYLGAQKPGVGMGRIPNLQQVPLFLSIEKSLRLGDGRPDVSIGGYWEPLICALERFSRDHSQKSGAMEDHEVFSHL